MICEELHKEEIQKLFIEHLLTDQALYNTNTVKKFS